MSDQSGKQTNHARESELISEEVIYRSYLTQDEDFVKDPGAGELKPLKNVGEDIRTKITHIERLDLGILGTVQAVSYGSWKGSPACLVVMRFNLRGNVSESRFRRIEILVSCEPWTGKYPIVRNFSPRNLNVRLDHDRKIWGWEALQRSWISQSSTPGLINASRADRAPSVRGSSWSKRRQQAAHQISWVVEKEGDSSWCIPDELNFAFVAEYDISFKAVVEVNAKTDIGLPLPLIALPWWKDDPLLFNGRTWIGESSRVREFDKLADADWEILAPYVPEWSRMMLRDHDRSSAAKENNDEQSGEGQTLPNLTSTATRDPTSNNERSTHGKDTGLSASSIVYRVRGIPFHYDYNATYSILKAGLGDQAEGELKVQSLTENPYRHEKVATIQLDLTPAIFLDEVSQGKSEWQIEVAEFLVSDNTNKPVQLVIDTHFRGFTPLHCFRESCDYNIDIIAVTGLGGRAFGSFKAKGSSHMWLRDSLGFDLPGARILTYGFDSHVKNSDSFQGILSLADQFKDSLRTIRNYEHGANPERPIIYIGHGLGGLIVKQALIAKADGDDTDITNLKATYGLLLFGVPSHGMNIESLVPRVGEQPNRHFVESLDRVSEILQAQNITFPKVFKFEDSELITFFETRRSPTAKKDGDTWTMTGEPAVLVDPFSATQGSTARYRQPLNRTHSELVKFSLQDDDYERVLGHLKRCATLAGGVIGKRFSHR